MRCVRFCACYIYFDLNLKISAESLICIYIHKIQEQRTHMINFMRLRLLLEVWMRRVRFCDCCFFLDRTRPIDFMRLLVGLRRVRFCAVFFFLDLNLKISAESPCHTRMFAPDIHPDKYLQARRPRARPPDISHTSIYTNTNSSSSYRVFEPTSPSRSRERGCSSSSSCSFGCAAYVFVLFIFILT